MSLLGDLFQRLVRFILDRICLLMELLFYTDNQAYLPPITDPLLLQPATILAAQIKSGKLKSETVVQAFISRIREVQPLINSIIDERFEAALEEARTLDATIAKQLAEKGELDASLRSKPFLGVPYTGKDGLAMKGLRFSCGMPDRKNIRSDEDSSIAKLWAEAGAIPLAMTNVPELLLWWDTVNKSFGRTHNPYNRALIPGGSTGGNASLISSAGSVMGIASDIGGSTRLPAYFCGVYGHACSVGSVPTDHQWPPFAPSRLRMVSYGPMCRYAADLRPLVQMYMSKAAGKKEFSSLKLNEQVKPSQLKVFYLTSFSDPSLSPTDKPLVRAIQAAARHLQSLGATVREVKAAEELTGLSAGFDAWMVKMFEDDTLPFSLELTNRNGHLNIYWELAKALVGLSEHTLPILFTALFQTLKKALPGAQAAREHCLAEHGRLKAALHRLLGDDGVLLLPTYPELSVKPVSCFLKFKNTVYAGVFNTLQVVMTSIPLGLTIEEDGVRGGPVPLGIQAVATHCNDHLTLTVAELLDRQFGGWAPPTKVMIK